MSADLEAEFTSLLRVAAQAHASQFFVRLSGDRAQAVAMGPDGEVPMAEWPASRAEALLPAAFGLCDKADTFAPGSARTMQMSGERLALPQGVRTVLVQFMPPRDGGRVLVARITREADMCCGTCGG